MDRHLNTFKQYDFDLLRININLTAGCLPCASSSVMLGRRQNAQRCQPSFYSCDFDHSLAIPAKPACFKVSVCSEHGDPRYNHVGLNSMQRNGQLYTYRPSASSAIATLHSVAGMEKYLIHKIPRQQLHSK